MQQDLYERALDHLQDYLIWLRDKGDTSEAYAAKRTAVARRGMGNASIQKARDFNSPSVGSGTAVARRGIPAWERRMELKWRAAGRLTPNGVLRPQPFEPWTLEQVAKAAPEANEWDHLAALIHLDGVVRRRFMNAHENIRAVVEGIADERLEKQLLDPTKGDAIRAIVRDEVGAMFAQLLGTMKRGGAQEPEALAPKYGQRTCKTCGVKGHTSRTCKTTALLAADKFACIPCSNDQGVSLEDPVTHPVPSEEFHKNDEARA